MRFASILLKAAVLVPVVYYGVLIFAAWMWPGYDHATQTIATLGSPTSPKAQIFNYGVIAAGGLIILGSLGVLLGMLRLGANIVWAFLTMVSLVVFGASLVQGGLHPAPDAMHDAYRLGLAIHAAPLLMFLGLAGRSDMGGLKALLFIDFLALAALWAVINNIGGLDLVQPATSGWWERGYSVAAILWIALAAIGIDGRLSAKTNRSRDEMRRVMFAEG